MRAIVISAPGVDNNLRVTEAPDRPGWDLIELNFTDTGWWSEHVASFGADVIVLEPSDLRDAVIGQLKGALA